MGLFKRRAQKDEPADAKTQPATRVLDQQDILDRLEEEIFRAERYGGELVILCVLPQRLPGEHPDPEEATLASEAIAARIRFSDRVGKLDDGTLLIVLPETPAKEARGIAHKSVADLAIRSAALKHMKWFVGASTYPDDGADPSSIVAAALHRAQA